MAGEPFNNYQFDLRVSNIQFNDARMLNRIIVGVIEAFGATAGGGFHQIADTSEVIEVVDPVVEALEAKQNACLKEISHKILSAESAQWLDGYVAALGYAIKVVKGEVEDGQN